MDYRVEKDSIGEKQVPITAYYGVQSLRAKENFPITGQKAEPEFINSLAALKKACALSNLAAGHLDAKIAKAICEACNEIMMGKFHDQFITDPIQGGAGTSFNMNANEVVANRAIEILGGIKGDYKIVHPNDHVNMSQSTNDIIPSAGKLTTIKLMAKAIEQLERLEKALAAKEEEFHDVIKMGRTQMQDAIPIRLGQEFGAYRAVVARDIKRLNHVIEEMHTVNMGATAIGTALNASKVYLDSIAPNISTVTGLKIEQCANLVDGTQNIDGFAAVSAALKTCAISLSKMSNDMRLMSSGPRTGFGEINLPAKQNGSSIMPGKVNPVIPEVMSQVAFNIIGNDFTITMAAEGGQLELNAFEPVTFYKLFESLRTLANGVSTFTDNCVEGITANEKHCRALLDHSVGMITAICPIVGYQPAADAAKEALKTGKSVKEILLAKGLMTAEEIDKTLDPFTMV